MALKKVRVQLLNEQTGDVLEAVDVLTNADAVLFSDGETFQQKLNAGKLKGATGSTGPQGADGAIGPKGDKGLTGDKGATGPQGAKGDTGAQGPKGADGVSGDGVKIGTTLATATEGKLFFKVMG